MNIPYRIERTRNRASRAVLVKDAVIIRLARGLSGLEERDHIETLLRRMAKAHAKQSLRTRIDPFRPLLQGAESLTLDLVTGRAVSFAVRAGLKTHAKRSHDGWSVWRSAATDERTFHRFLWRLLSDSARKGTDAAVRAINQETMNFPVRSVKLRFMGSRWGSCSQDGNIGLSTPLLLTTPDIFRYVVLHELAHRKHLNHSAAFWRLVGDHVDDVTAVRKALRAYRLPASGKP